MVFYSAAESQFYVANIGFLIALPVAGLRALLRYAFEPNLLEIHLRRVDLSRCTIIIRP